MALIYRNNLLYFKDNDGKERRIGFINKTHQTLEIYRERKKHLHRNTNAYGLNKEALDSGLFKYIRLAEDDGKQVKMYVFPVEETITLPAYKASDFEIQLMASLDWLKQYEF